MRGAADLIKYIVWYATQHDQKLTTVRVVKFLYLSDLYYARSHKGKTLTGWPWAFVYYGPYCNEAMKAIDNVVFAGVICRETFASKFPDSKDYNLFTCNDPDAKSLEDELPIEMLSQLKEDIKRYGEDTAALLDYVYFDTEPMADAKKEELLDFSKAKPVSRPKEINLNKLSKDKIELARRHIRKFGEELRKGKERLHKEELDTYELKDEIYYRALEVLDEEELETGLKGVAEISE